jgi:uncharacterized damage-inducible protein DinB
LDLLAYLKKLFTYDDWANREVIRALQELPHSPLKAVRLMGHIVAVEYLWLSRLKQEPSPVVWPEWTIAEIASQQHEVNAAIFEYLASLAGERLLDEVGYANSKGERWTNTVADILMHTTMHSAYHRGQIALVLREAGIAPPYTDFIQAVRAHNIAE